MMEHRVERDLLGEEAVPADAYWGIHTLRAVRNFSLSGYRIDPALIRSYAFVKKGCALVNGTLGFLDDRKLTAIVTACDELISGSLADQFPVDAFAGGAGTSINMNVNEVIANRALELIGCRRGEYDVVSPLGDVNRHQSTNDTFPTAVKVAVLFELIELEKEFTSLQQACQDNERRFRDVLVQGRSELVEAVPMTAGRQWSAYAEAFSQDRWRVFKARERLRTVPLGGTAVGTGLAAPRDFIFRVTDELRALTGLNLCRAENPVYVTQHADSFVEASAILKTAAVNLIKLADDLRRLFLVKEVRLGPVQAGSSIMPGKVNPVQPEAVIQACLRVLSDDTLVAEAASRGSLQINEFMPLIAFSLLESLRFLKKAASIMTCCAWKLDIDEARARAAFDASPVIMTAFLPLLGYERVQELVIEYGERNDMNVREFLYTKMDRATVDDVLSPDNLTRLGHPL
jgi:aspartate ammonia-lyase